ncbi:hypothetical protein F5Y16DRAFT_323227 [Xylariaceae sp. FL0255]|nr:hypothetical protein F5Y16DRAFT_323227 [Xylariaceae sp. FL0255]
MASTYEHQPLKSSRAIRVLTLEPAKSPESIIKCSLGELDLDNITRSTRYEALSYVWGARKGTIPILCEGKEILVTPNCHDAMLQLRLRSKQRRLFIDAICIDQRPDTPSRREREGQVKIMGIVYERASRVIVWLDKIQPPSEQRLFRFIRIFAWIGRLEAKVRPGRSFLDGPIPGAVSWCC